MPAHLPAADASTATSNRKHSGSGKRWRIGTSGERAGPTARASAGVLTRLRTLCMTCQEPIAEPSLPGAPGATARTSPWTDLPAPLGSLRDFRLPRAALRGRPDPVVQLSLRPHPNGTWQCLVRSVAIVGLRSRGPGLGGLRATSCGDAGPRPRGRCESACAAVVVAAVPGVVRSGQQGSPSPWFSGR